LKPRSKRIGASVFARPQGLRGLWGFVLHAEGNLRGPSVHAFENFIYGAPPMAPLLFPNLMVLGIIALWQLRTNST